MAVVVPLLVPIVTSVIAALGLVFKEARLARSRRNIRERAIAEANAEVNFARDWWQAHQLLGADQAGSTETALQMLAIAQEKVTNTQHLSVSERNPVTPRRLLLMYPMRTRSAKALRLLSWLSGGSLLIIMLVIAGQAIEGKGNQELGGAAGALAFFALITLGLRAWAVSANHSGSQRSQADVPTLTSSAEPALSSLIDTAR